MAITKSIEFFAPYIAKTFNDKDKLIAGLSGMLYGGEVTVDTATTVDLAAYAFVQNGLIVEQDADTTGITVPDYSSDQSVVHILVSSPDAKETSGVTVTVSTDNADISESSIVIASRQDNIWVYPPRMSLAALRAEALGARLDATKGPLADNAPAELNGWFDKSIGTDQGLRIRPGAATDPDGAKRFYGGDPALNNANLETGALDLEIKQVDPDFEREDHVVLRKSVQSPSASPEMEYIYGETYKAASSTGQGRALAGSVSIDNTAGNTAPAVETTVSGATVAIWGNGTNLKLSRLAYTTSRTPGAIDTLAVGATVNEIQVATIPGITAPTRTYGVCSAGAAGSEEIYIFRTTVGSATFDTVTAISSHTNGATNPRIAMDADGYAHIVYEYDENGAGTNNQIYYIRYNTDSSVWGTGSAIAVSQRHARGGNGGKNDFDPQIAIHPDGNLHIAFVRRTGAGTTGDITKIVITKAGDVVESDTTISASVGDGTGGTHTPTAYSRPRIAIAPQGNVYVAWIDDGASATSVICYETDVLGKTGYNALFITSKAITVSLNFHSFHAHCDQMGRLNILFDWEDTGVTTRVDRMLLTPDFPNDGVRTKGSVIDDSWYETTSYDNADIKIDRNGSIHSLRLLGNQISHERYTSAPLIVYPYGPLKPFFPAMDHHNAPRFHQRDSHLLSVSHPEGVSNEIQRDGLTMVHRRKTETKAPFTAVGHNGDYHGYWGLNRAIESLRGVGGKIIVRGGYHRLVEPLKIISGVEIYADGHCVLDFDTTNTGTSYCINITGGHYDVSTVDATNYKYLVDENFFEFGYRPGDLCFSHDQNAPDKSPIGGLDGPWVITRIDPINNWVWLDQDISGLISGYTVPRLTVYNTGSRLEGFTILDRRRSVPGVHSTLIHSLCAGLLLKDLVIVVEDADIDPVIRHTAGWNVMYERVYVSQSGHPLTNVSLEVDGTASENIILDSRTVINSCWFQRQVHFPEVYVTEYAQVANSHAWKWDMANTFVGNAWVSNYGEVTNTGIQGGGFGYGGGAHHYLDNVYTAPANDATGHLTGEWTPTADGSNLGTPTKRWDAYLLFAQIYGDIDPVHNIIPDAPGTRTLGSLAFPWGWVYSRTANIAPDAVDSGMMMSGLSLSNYIGGNYMVGGVRTDNSIQPFAVAFEPTGRIAQGHGIFDDFVYHRNNWTSAATAPKEYAAASGGGTADVAIKGDVFGGVVELNADGTNSATLDTEGFLYCNPNLTAPRRITAFFRLALDDIGGSNGTARVYVGSSALLDTQFGFEWSNSAGTWRAFTKSDVPAYAYSSAIITPSAGAYYNFYCRSYDNTTAEFWIEGGSRVTLTMPSSFSSKASERWGMSAFIQAGFAETPSILLDSWELREDKAVFGREP